MANPNAYDLARIYRISAVAAMRGGEFTDRQKRALQRIKDRTDKRDGKK